MLSRTQIVARIEQSLRNHTTVVVVGPYQCGLTTLGRQLQARLGRQVRWVDLDDPAQRDQADRLFETTGRDQLMIVDHAESAAEMARSLAARCRAIGQRCLAFSSVRIESLSPQPIQVDGFAAAELPELDERTIWFRGGLPLSVLAQSEIDSVIWRRRYLIELLERIDRVARHRQPIDQVRRFLQMLAQQHGELWNASPYARSLGVSPPTIERYRRLLHDAMVVTELPARTLPLAMRQRRAPRLFVSDSGLFHTVIGVGAFTQLLSHPQLGASWEWFACKQVMTHGAFDLASCRHWSNHTGAKLDLVVETSAGREAYLFQANDRAPSTPRLRRLFELTTLDRLTVVRPGKGRIQLFDQCDWIGLGEFAPRTLP